MKSVIDQLQAAGIQPTAQRIAIGSFMLKEADHPTVEEVKKVVDERFPKVSLATVYNTLNRMVEAGLLKRIKMPHSEKVVYDQNTDDHYHFIDDKTGEMIDIEPSKVTVEPHLSKSMRVREIELFIHGHKT